MAIKPEDYTNAAELQRAAAFIAEPAKVQTTEGNRVLALCHQVADLLEPFALVDTTNERWRDEVLAVAKKVHDAAMALRIGNSVLGTLLEGIGGLIRYGDMAEDLAACDQMDDEDTMDAPQMMDAMAEAIACCAASANVHPLDEWQLNEGANAVNNLGYSLVSKLIDHHHEDNECTRAEQLLLQAAEVLSAAAAREGLSTRVKEHFTHFAENARRKRTHIAGARAEAREVDRRKRLSNDPLWRR